MKFRNNPKNKPFEEKRFPKMRNKKRFVFLSVTALVLILFISTYSNLFYSGVKPRILYISEILLFICAYFAGLSYFFFYDKKNYPKSWVYIKKVRYYLVFVVFIFVIFGIIGYLFQTPMINDYLKKMIEELVSKTQGFNLFEMFWFIFENNTSVAFLSILFGILFGLFPFMTIVFNGYVIGFVLQKSVVAQGPLVALKLFPHGIFELPAILIAISLGIRFGLFVFSKKPDLEIKERFRESIRVLVFVIVPLLFIAAIIESSLIFLLK